VDEATIFCCGHYLRR